MTPTTACAGWAIGGAGAGRRKREAELRYGISDGDTTLKTMEYVWMGNFLGCPGISVPMGFVDPGTGDVAGEGVEGRVPVGLMALGEWADEEGLLRLGGLVEGLNLDGKEKVQARPPIWVDVVEKARGFMVGETEA